jgi:hypothetical protein
MLAISHTAKHGLWHVWLKENNAKLATLFLKAISILRNFGIVTNQNFSPAHTLHRFIASDTFEAKLAFDHTPITLNLVDI